MKAVLFTEEHLKQAIYDSVVYVTCPYCETEVAVEPDAREACCIECGEMFRIINWVF
jgi:hypothetical protein